MSSTTVCVDASIVVRLLAPTPSSNVFPYWKEWLDTGALLVAPSLLRYEIVNSFHRMRVAGNVTDSMVKDFLNLALSLPITYFDDDWIHRDAMRMASEYGQKAAYDAHYVALAQHLGAELWTADKRLYNALQHHLDFVHLVE